MIHVQLQFGQRKGKILHYPKEPGLRPTLARSRDVLFNWVSDFSKKYCLDVFAGTGILGIQALSLGAQHVDFIERSRSLSRCIALHLKEMSFDKKSIVWALTFSQAFEKINNKYDFIFLDPPFTDLQAALQAWNMLRSYNLIHQNALIYLEVPKGEAILLPSTKQLKHKQIGDVWIYLLQYESFGSMP